MKQEIYMPNGQRIFCTEDERVMYDKETLTSMVNAGYKVKINDKIWKPTKND